MLSNNLGIFLIVLASATCDSNFPWQEFCGTFSHVSRTTIDTLARLANSKSRKLHENLSVNKNYLVSFLILTGKQTKIRTEITEISWQLTTLPPVSQDYVTFREVCLKHFDFARGKSRIGVEKIIFATSFNFQQKSAVGSRESAEDNTPSWI